MFSAKLEVAQLSTHKWPFLLLLGLSSNVGVPCKECHQSSLLNEPSPLRFRKDLVNVVNFSTQSPWFVSNFVRSLLLVCSGKDMKRRCLVSELSRHCGKENDATPRFTAILKFQLETTAQSYTHKARMEDFTELSKYTSYPHNSALHVELSSSPFTFENVR